MAVNLNRANLEDLTKLHGIAEGTAEKIINYRNEHGIFRSWEDVKKIPGFGDSLVEHLKDGGVEVGEEYIDIAKDLTKQLSNSYLTSFNLGLSLWENNLRMINEYNKNIGQLISLQQEIYRPLVDVFNPRELHFGRDLIERTFAIQRDYINKIRELSERGIQRMKGEMGESTS